MTQEQRARHREQVALCYDVSLDGMHASLVAAAVVDGRVHTEVVATWDVCVLCGLAHLIVVGPGTTDYGWVTSFATPPCDHETLDGRQ